MDTQIVWSHIARFKYLSFTLNVQIFLDTYYMEFYGFEPFSKDRSSTVVE